MTAKKKEAVQRGGRMRSHMERRNKGEVIDPTPIELPAGTRNLPSVSQQIQEQIAIQIAKKQTGF